MGLENFIDVQKHYCRQNFTSVKMQLKHITNKNVKLQNYKTPRNNLQEALDDLWYGHDIFRYKIKGIIH